jgi:PAS domain S-box-containing protein
MPDTHLDNTNHPRYHPTQSLFVLQAMMSLPKDGCMPEIESTILDRPTVRVALSGVTVATAFLLRQVLVRFGNELPPFIAFYPAVMIAAVLCGFRIGLLATALSALLADLWIFPPIGQLAISSTSQAISLAVFISMGAFMSAAAGRYRRYSRQVAAFERDQALREANQQLHVTEQRLRLFIEHAPAALAMFDDKMRYLSVSSRWMTDFGLGERDLRGVSHYDVFPEVPEQWKDAHLRGLGGEVVREEAERFERADGSKQWIRWEIRPWHDVAGKVGGIVIFTEDITGRMRAETALQNSQERMGAIISSAMDAVITIGADQRILVFNAAAEKTFGCPAAVAIGQSLDRFIPAGFREAHRRYVEAFASSGTTSRSMQSPGILFGLRANDEEFPLEATISQVTVSGEKLYTVILRDLTQRMQTEQALIRSEKLASFGRMAATIAHEINNPLAAVTNSLFLAANVRDLPDSARQFLVTADEELRRIAHITRQSLGFYRESNAPALTSVGALLESTVDLLKGRIKAKAAVIEKQWDGDVVVTAVAGELRQVFSNLLSNSLDAIEQKGTVTLRVTAGTAPKNGQRCVRITIADDGKGIPASSQPQIFEPFFTTKGTTGTGLGLWVGKQIIDKHHGTIRVRSTTQGARRGTVFSIVLPVEPAAAASSQSAGA